MVVAQLARRLHHGTSRHALTAPHSVLLVRSPAPRIFQTHRAFRLQTRSFSAAAASEAAGLPFRLSENDALEAFQAWDPTNRYRIVSTQKRFAPFWCADVQIACTYRGAWASGSPLMGVSWTDGNGTSSCSYSRCNPEMQVFAGDPDSFSDIEQEMLKMPLDTKPQRISALSHDLDTVYFDRNQAESVLTRWAKEAEREKAETTFRRKYNATSVQDMVFGFNVQTPHFEVSYLPYYVIQFETSSGTKRCIVNGYNGTLIGPKMPQEFSVNAAAHIWGPFAASIVAFMQFGGQAAVIVPAMLFYSFWSMFRLVGSQGPSPQRVIRGASGSFRQRERFNEAERESAKQHKEFQNAWTSYRSRARKHSRREEEEQTLNWQSWFKTQSEADDFDWKRDLNSRRKRWEAFNRARAAEQQREWDWARTARDNNRSQFEFDASARPGERGHWSTFGSSAYDPYGNSAAGDPTYDPYASQYARSRYTNFKHQTTQSADDYARYGGGDSGSQQGQHTAGGAGAGQYYQQQRTRTRFSSQRGAAPRMQRARDIKLYRVLGVSPSATQDEIRKAWRAAAKKYHPDLHSGQNLERFAGRFKEASRAFDILKDPVKRRRYDRGESVQ